MKIQFEQIRGAGQGQEDKNKVKEMTSEIAEANAEREYLKQRAQKLIDGNKFNFELFAESAAPRFVLSDRFAIDYKKKEVHMQTKWFQDREFSDEQLLWATYHELAHFYDFANDHRAILKKSEQIQESARETGAALAGKYKELYGEALPEEAAKWLEQKPIDSKHPEKGTMNKFEEIGYGIHHNFWNCLDDIYVNSLVAKRKPAYGGGGRHDDEVGRLYREQLFFKESDFSSLPRHKQLAYALLRRAMVTGEVTVVSDEVEATLNQRHFTLGKEYTAEELIHEFIKARNTLGVNAGLRYEILEKTLAPVFDELLSKDIADWKLPEPKESQKGEDGQGEQKENQDKSGGQDGEDSQSESGEQADGKNEKGDKEGEGEQGKSGREGEGENHEGAEEQGAGKSDDSQDQSFAENIDDAFNPDKKDKSGEPGGHGDDGPSIPFPIQSPEDIKDIAEQFGKWKKEWQDVQQEKKEADKEEPAQSREKRLKESRDKQWCEQYEVDYETFKRYEEVERAIKPYLVALDNLWRKIIYGHTKETVIQSMGHYKEGEELDVEETVREFSKILFAELDKIKIMTRSESIREIVHKPDLIRVRFIGDASGSMNHERRTILEQAHVLIFSSLRRFETYLNLTRGKTKSKLSVDTEARIFGSDEEIIKHFRGRGGYNQEKAKIIKSFGGLREDKGGTRDDEALSAVNESLTEPEIQKIKNKKIMELVFELTDGGTNSEGITSAKKALADLDKKGVIARAFQIGTTDKIEQETFNNVWNTDQNGVPLREKRGEIVGVEIKNLIPALTSTLAKYLSRVEL